MQYFVFSSLFARELQWEEDFVFGNERKVNEKQAYEI